jgi:hypothetical protein
MAAGFHLNVAQPFYSVHFILPQTDVQMLYQQELLPTIKVRHCHSPACPMMKCGFYQGLLQNLCHSTALLLYQSSLTMQKRPDKPAMFTFCPRVQKKNK